MPGICQYPQCRKTAAYNVEGELERAYCKAHCMELFPGREVSNLAGKRCQVAPDCKAQAVWGPKVEAGRVQAQACQKHKMHGMLRAGARYCVTDGCTVRAACGFPVEKPVAETCSRHRLPGMVDLRALRKQRAAGVAASRSDEDDEVGQNAGDSPSRRRPRAATAGEERHHGDVDDSFGMGMKRRRVTSFHHHPPPMGHFPPPPAPLYMPAEYDTSVGERAPDFQPLLPGQQDLPGLQPKAVTGAGDRAAALGGQASSSSSPAFVGLSAAPPVPMSTFSSSSSSGASPSRDGAVVGPSDCVRPSRDCGVYEQGGEEKGEDLMVAAQVELVPGDGSFWFCLPYYATTGDLSSTASGIMHEAARVSVSWAKLHHDALLRCFGSCVGTRRFQPLDSTVDIKVHAPLGITTTSVLSEQYQAGQAAAAGCAIACRTIEAFCQCTFRSSMTVVGELTLGGVMLPVNGLDTTLGSIKRKGTVFLPWDSVPDVENFVARGTQTFRAKNLASVLPALVDGHGDNLNDASESLTSTWDYACVSSMLPGLQLIEVAVFPGKGEVIMTGHLKLPALNCLGAALVWLRKNVCNVVDRLRLVRGYRVEPLFDLIKMERCATSADHSNSTLDVHIHLPGLDYPKSDSSHGPAAVLCLVSVMTGLPLPPGIAVHASLTGNGSLQVPPSPSSVADLEAAVSAAVQAGIRLLLVPASAETLFKPRFPEQDAIKVVGVWTILDAVQVAFGPYANGWDEDQQQQQQQVPRDMSAKPRVRHVSEDQQEAGPATSIAVEYA